jgi:zinc transporter 1
MVHQSVFLHVLGDALGSVGVIVSAIVIRLATGWGTWRFMVDPLCTILIVFIILYNAVPLFKHSVSVLLQGAPARVDLHSLAAALRTIDGVKSVHALHVWQLTNSNAIGSVHLVLRDTEHIPAITKVRGNIARF